MLYCPASVQRWDRAVQLCTLFTLPIRQGVCITTCIHVPAGGVVIVYNKQQTYLLGERGKLMHNWLSAQLLVSLPCLLYALSSLPIIPTGWCKVCKTMLCCLANVVTVADCLLLSVLMLLSAAMLDHRGSARHDGESHFFKISISSLLMM